MAAKTYHARRAGQAQPRRGYFGSGSMEYKLVFTCLQAIRIRAGVQTTMATYWSTGTSAAFLRSGDLLYGLPRSKNHSTMRHIKATGHTVATVTVVVTRRIVLNSDKRNWLVAIYPYPPTDHS